MRMEKRYFYDDSRNHLQKAKIAANREPRDLAKQYEYLRLLNQNKEYKKVKARVEMEMREKNDEIMSEYIKALVALNELKDTSVKKLVSVYQNKSNRVPIIMQDSSSNLPSYSSSGNSVVIKPLINLDNVTVQVVDKQKFKNLSRLGMFILFGALLYFIYKKDPSAGGGGASGLSTIMKTEVFEKVFYIFYI